MNHQRVKSSNVYSLAHEGETLEARFICSACKAQDSPNCMRCGGKGHTETYRYEKVSAETYRKVIESRSVGSAFDLLVKRKARGVRV